MSSSFEPLSRYPRLRTRNPDELEHFLAGKGLGFELPGAKPHPRELDVLINAYHLPSMCICYVRYGMPIELAAPADFQEFNLFVAANGAFHAHVGKDTVRATGDTAVLGSPTVDQRTILEQDASRYSISISQHALVLQLESLLGSPLTSPLRFAPTVELGAGAGRRLGALLRLLFDDDARPGNGFDCPLVASQLEQLLISYLLAHQPHNYASRLERQALAPAPRDVRRVLDYIEGNLRQPITLDGLVAVSGVAGRSLNEHFRRHTGKSPLAYVAEQRLAQARRDLLMARDDETVTTVATRWGFSQLGRFAGVYRNTYGESPSETLRRIRRRVVR